MFSRKLLSFVLFLSATAAFAGPKVLVVGDSHATGTFKDGLLSVLDGQPDIETAVYASCGSSPAGWFRNSKGQTYKTSCGYYQRPFGGKPSTEVRAVPEFADLVAKDAPDFVVVAMGTNQYRGTPAAAKPSLQKMIRASKTGGARCIFVAPPEVGIITVEKQRQFYAMFEELAKEEKCGFVDSRKFTDVSDTDRMKIHYPGKPGSNWGKSAGSRILTFVREAGATSGAAAGSAGSSATSSGGN